MNETRNPSSLRSARKTSTPIRAQTTVTGCGILVYFVSNSGSSICDFRDAFGIGFAVELLPNATRETECANRSMLRSNDFPALAYFFEYPTLFFLDISSSSLPFIGTPSGTPQPILQFAPASDFFTPPNASSPRPCPQCAPLPAGSRCRPWAHKPGLRASGSAFRGCNIPA